MLILNFYDIENFSFPKCAVALGSFESLHAGHLKIINETVNCAKVNGIKSLITIFKAPILKTRNLVCETLDERLNIIEKCGIDIVVIFDFNEEFSKIKYDEFFNSYIFKKFNTKFLFTGFNYRFGNKAEGDTEKLAALCKNNNIFLNVIPPVVISKVISSTYVYELINNGDVETLQKILERPYSIVGLVSEGRKIGNKIGFPTANIAYPTGKAIIKDGVYFGTAETIYGKYYAMINVGTQPTVTDENTPKIEAYIFDFNKNIYGQKIKLEFFNYMRKTKKFSNINELINKLDTDKNLAKKLIKELKNTCQIDTHPKS